MTMEGIVISFDNSKIVRSIGSPKHNGGKKFLPRRSKSTDYSGEGRSDRRSNSARAITSKKSPMKRCKSANLALLGESSDSSSDSTNGQWQRPTVHKSTSSSNLLRQARASSMKKSKSVKGLPLSAIESNKQPQSKLSIDRKEMPEKESRMKKVRSDNQLNTQRKQSSVRRSKSGGSLSSALENKTEYSSSQPSNTVKKTRSKRIPKVCSDSRLESPMDRKEPSSSYSATAVKMTRSKRMKKAKSESRLNIQGKESLSASADYSLSSSKKSNKDGSSDSSKTLQTMKIPRVRSKNTLKSHISQMKRATSEYGLSSFKTRANMVSSSREPPKVPETTTTTIKRAKSDCSVNALIDFDVSSTNSRMTQSKVTVIHKDTLSTLTSSSTETLSTETNKITKATKSVTFGAAFGSGRIYPYTDKQDPTSKWYSKEDLKMLFEHELQIVRRSSLVGRDNVSKKGTKTLHCCWRGLEHARDKFFKAEHIANHVRLILNIQEELRHTSKSEDNRVEELRRRCRSSTKEDRLKAFKLAKQDAWDILRDQPVVNQPTPIANAPSRGISRSNSLKNLKALLSTPKAKSQSKRDCLATPMRNHLLDLSVPLSDDTSTNVKLPQRTASRSNSLRNLKIILSTPGPKRKTKRDYFEKLRPTEFKAPLTNAATAC